MRKAVSIDESPGNIRLYSAFFCVHFIRFTDFTEEGSRQNLRKSAEGIFEPVGDRSIWNVFLFCDPHDAGTEVCTAFHVTDPGINRIYFCIGDGILFSEREIYQKKACGICTDSGRRYYI